MVNSSDSISIASLPMNFRISLDARVRAAAGIPAYMRRKRRIEDLMAALREQVEQVREQALLSGSSLEQAQEQARVFAQRLDLRLLNDLIDRHNRFYPIEANLPTDVRTGRMMAFGKPWEPDAKVTWRDFV